MDLPDRVILVLGAPCSGTSCVAGILRHLGVDMGEPIASDRPYETFEDSRRACQYAAEPTEAQQFIMGGGRDFRAYLKFRLAEAREKGTIPGVKIGAAYWLGDPDPASLPVTIVKVDRPLEDSIRSDWRYRYERAKSCVVSGQVITGTPYINQDARILRAAQMAGYWQAKERLCEIIEPAVVVDYRALTDDPTSRLAYLSSLAIMLYEEYGHKRNADQKAAAAAFVNPELRNV